MNWGYDGDYDNGRYTLGVDDVWSADAYNFQFRKQMLYNFQKK